MQKQNTNLERWIQ